MADFAAALGASKGASTLLVLFIPSRDRADGHRPGLLGRGGLKTLGMLFGGATAFPQGKGVWRDDAQGGKLLFDEPVIIQCYASEQAIESRTTELRRFLHRMGREARQGAIGLVIDRDYLEIGFPLEPITSPGDRRARKGDNAHGQEHQIHRRRPRCQSRQPGARYRRRRVRCRPPGQCSRAFRAGWCPARASARPPERRELGTPPESAHERGYAAAALRWPSAPRRRAKVSPMQIAAQILEDALAGVPEQ